MRISDWSSDVCSSDLLVIARIAVQRVVAVGVGIVAMENVIARPARHVVAAGLAVEDVVIVSAGHPVAAAAAIEDVVARAAVDGIVAREDRKSTRLNSSH